MVRVFHDDRVERNLTSRLDRSKERARIDMFHRIRDNLEEVSKRIAMKLIEDQLIETNSKKEIEEQVQGCLESLLDSDEFEINYAVAPFRNVVVNPNLVVLWTTAFVIEKLINHRSVVDIFGSDEQIYRAIHSQVEPFLARRRREM
ncbi:MAG: hypothetical protein JRJ59_00405 [Deltaproteobacteria bacterium]|nr:hypothetical protein [Deltaproteobacteria bacterium]